MMSKVNLLIGIALFLIGCSGKDSTRQVGETETPQKPTESVSSDTHVMDSAVGSTELILERIAADDPPIDLLTRCLPEHVVRGNARWEQTAEGGQALVLDQPQQGSQVVIPVDPPPHYEMHLHLTLLEGDETFFWGIRAGARQGMLSLDAFPRGGYATGVGTIGNKRPGHKDFWPRVRGRLLTKNQTVELRCLATPDDICIALDGKRLLHLDSESVHELRMADFFTPPSPKCLFVGTWNARYRVEKFILEPLQPLAAAERLKDMLAAEKLRTALIVNTLPPDISQGLYGELRAALAGYRILERKDQDLKTDGLPAVESLYQPGFLPQRRMLARDQAADLVLISGKAESRSPHNRLFVFGDDGTLAGYYLLPYTGNMQLEKSLAHRAAAAATEKVRRQAILLSLADWTVEPTAAVWSGPTREVMLASVSLSPWCRLNELEDFEATSESGPREIWEIHGHVSGDAQSAVVQLDLHIAPQAAPLRCKIELSDVESNSGQQLATAVASLLDQAGRTVADSAAELQVLAADLSPLPKNNRSPLALLMCGRAASHLASDDFLAAADCFAGAALVEPNREVYQAKAAWCCAKVSGLPGEGAAAFLRGLRHLRFAEQVSRTPDKLRGEGHFVHDIPELLLKMGQEVLAELNDEDRVALQTQQARSLLQLVARRYDAGVAADLYIDYLKETTPSDQRERIWRPIIDELEQQDPGLHDAFTPLLEPTLGAKQAAPTLQQVLNEGLAACKSLAEREATSADFAFDGGLSRGLLTYALMRVGQRQAVDDLFSDEAEKLHFVAVTEELLVEATGEVPEIPSGMALVPEMSRRQMISLSLARRGDFDKANEQIAAFPKYENMGHFAIRSYLFVAERQLEIQDLAGARQTIRELWPCIRDLEDQDRLRKAEWIIKLAKLTSQAREQSHAQKLCLMADEILDELRRAKSEEPQDLNFALRELAIAHAMSANAQRARDLLAVCQQQAELIEDARDKSEHMITLEETNARVAELSGQNDVALAAYARALDWVKQRDRESLNSEADQLEFSGIVAKLLSVGEGGDLRTIALGQLQAGDKRAALETWEQMPLCIQKPATLLEMAKALHQRGATAEARELAVRCADLDRPDFPANDYVAITAFVANIYRAIGDEEVAQAAAKKLLNSPRVQESLEAKQMAAAELTDFHLFPEAYSMIETIESLADRALPLAKLAEGLVKSGQLEINKQIDALER